MHRGNNLVRSLVNHPWVRDYGMVFVLLLLMALFSSLTIRDQFPVGKEAGKQVAEKILARRDRDSIGVLIVTRDTAEDRAFAAAVRSRLQGSSGRMLGSVQGEPADARIEIERILARGETIDAIAANSVTAKWNIYDRYPEVGKAKCVTPTSYRWPTFLKSSNLVGVANQTSIYAIIAIGMTIVIVTGGIDLSVGSLVALAAVATAVVIRDWGGGSGAPIAAVWLASILGIAVCGFAGLVSGVLITRFQVPPFIATLGMMMIASGLAFRWSEGTSIPELPASLFSLGQGSTGRIPNPVLMMLIAYGVAHLIMSRTIFGRYVYAIGGNVQAARLSGIPVSRTLVIVYALCGALAGFGGLVLTSQLSAGDPKFGGMYELEVIAAVVVGGTSLMGGRGKIFGTLIGAFIIAVIRNGMNLTDIDPFNQKIVLGGVLVLAVLIDMAKRSDQP